MCLTTQQKEDIILEEDIIVYKVLDVKRKKFLGITIRNKYESFYMGFPYIFKHLYNTTIRKCTSVDNNEYFFIYEGFHFYRNLNNRNLRYEGKNIKFNAVVKCLIPKGSTIYYDNDENNGEGVSNQIIILKEIKI